jgi:hypothetical protein
MLTWRQCLSIDLTIHGPQNSYYKAYKRRVGTLHNSPVSYSSLKMLSILGILRINTSGSLATDTAGEMALGVSRRVCRGGVRVSHPIASPPANLTTKPPPRLVLCLQAPSLRVM